MGTAFPAWILQASTILCVGRGRLAAHPSSDRLQFLLALSPEHRARAGWSLAPVGTAAQKVCAVPDGVTPAVCAFASLHGYELQCQHDSALVVAVDRILLRPLIAD